MSDKDKCPKCGAECIATISPRYACGTLGIPGVLDGPQQFMESHHCLRRQLAEAKAKHQAWTDAFGTTQLSHAIAALGAAKDRERMAKAENENLRRQLAAQERKAFVPPAPAGSEYLMLGSGHTIDFTADAIHDLAAMAALQGLLAHGSHYPEDTTARLAWQEADAFMVQRGYRKAAEAKGELP